MVCAAWLLGAVAERVSSVSASDLAVCGASGLFPHSAG